MSLRRPVDGEDNCIADSALVHEIVEGLLVQGNGWQTPDLAGVSLGVLEAEDLVPHGNAGHVGSALLKDVGHRQLREGQV